MPHKVEKIGGYWRVRSWVTGRLLKEKYRSYAKAKAAAQRSYDRSKRIRSKDSKRAKKSKRY